MLRVKSQFLTLLVRLLLSDGIPYYCGMTESESQHSLNITSLSLVWPLCSYTLYAPAWKLQVSALYLSCERLLLLPHFLAGHSIPSVISKILLFILPLFISVSISEM